MIVLVTFEGGAQMLWDSFDHEAVDAEFPYRGQSIRYEKLPELGAFMAPGTLSYTPTQEETS